jgi:hypothetical protein
MISKFQYDTVRKLLGSGVSNYVQIRQQVGLTNDELYDILEHFDYYQNKFDEEERLAKVEQLKQEKKPWWKRK